MISLQTINTLYPVLFPVNNDDPDAHTDQCGQILHRHHLLSQEDSRQRDTEYRNTKPEYRHLSHGVVFQKLCPYTKRRG